MRLPLNPVVWLSFTCLVYLVASMINLFVYQFVPMKEYIEMVWLCTTALPLFIPMSKVVDIDTIWRIQ